MFLSRKGYGFTIKKLKILKIFIVLQKNKSLRTIINVCLNASWKNIYADGVELA